MILIQMSIATKNLYFGALIPPQARNDKFRIYLDEFYKCINDTNSLYSFNRSIFNLSLLISID